MYRLCTFTGTCQCMFGRLLTLFALAVLAIGSAATIANAQSVSIDLPQVGTGRLTTPTATFTLLTDERFNQPTAISLIVTADTSAEPKTVSFPADTDSHEFTISRSDFAAGQNADGTLNVTVDVVVESDTAGYSLGASRQAEARFDVPTAAPVVRQPGQLTLTKTIITGPAARPGAFKFLFSGAITGAVEYLPTQTGPDEFAPTKIVPQSVPADGTVTVTDDPPPGFKFSGVSCTIGGTPHGTTAVAENSFDVTIPAGATVNCTVTNTPPPVTATVSLQETVVNVAQDTGSVTLTLATTEAFDGPKSVPLAITTGSVSNFQSIAVVLPKDEPEVEFTLKKSDFETALAADGSLKLVVKIDDTKLDDSFEIGKSETTVNFAAPSVTVAPTPTVVLPATPTLTLQTLSTGSTGTFQFTVQYGATSRQASITTTRANEVKGLAAFAVAGGQLVITQSATTDFTFFDANCSLGGNSHPRVINIDARTVSIQMPATGNVVCTIINRGEETHTKTVVSRFVKRRVQQLTSHIGQTRRSTGRFAGSRRTGGGVGLSGAGTEAAGRLGMQTSLSRLGGAMQPGSPTAKAAKLGVDASDYGVDDGPQFRSGWDVWTEGSWSYHTSDRRRSGGLASSGQFGVLRAGADYLVNSKLLLGVVAQYDYLSDSSKTKSADGYRIHGHGWLAGPYVEVGLTQNLFFDAKALWGTSKNEISPNLSFTDEFTTRRWLASARLTGSWSWKHTERGAWTFSPRAEVVWFNESVTSYTNAQGVAIDGDDAHLGRFNIGPEFSYRYTAASGIAIEPRFGAQALLSFSRSDTSAGDGLDSATRTSVKDTPLDSFQMRFIGGLKIELPEGTRVELEGSYTGLGQQGYESVSGKIGLTIPLQ